MCGPVSVARAEKHCKVTTFFLTAKHFPKKIFFLIDFHPFSGLYGTHGCRVSWKLSTFAFAMKDNNADTQATVSVKPTVLDVDDVVDMVPRLAGHRTLVRRVLHWLSLDRVNQVHANSCSVPGHECADKLMHQEFDISYDIDGIEILDSLPREGAFITVSNHPFGALDGIALIDIVGRRRPDFKVMVNMILNRIEGLRPCFIAVDALASADPKKKAVSMQGIRAVIGRVREGHPVGFFPAGAVSKVKNNLRLEDRQWQSTVIRLIQQLRVPVYPIFFHGSNSWWFNLLGRISWQLRTLRLPAEVFRKMHKTLHISVGKPISVDEQKAHSGSLEELGEFLKSRTYALRQCRRSRK